MLLPYIRRWCFLGEIWVHHDYTLPEEEAHRQNPKVLKVLESNQNARILGRKNACFRVETNKPSFTSMVHYIPHIAENHKTQRERQTNTDRGRNKRDRETQKNTERKRTWKKLRRNILGQGNFRLSTASLSDESRSTDLHHSGQKLHRGICSAWPDYVELCGELLV